MAVLFYTIGLPCAGKTTLAHRLTQWLEGTHLQADAVGRSLFIAPTFSPAERIAVYQHMDYQAMAALNAGRYVLYDGTLTSLEQRHHLRQLAAQCGTQAIGVWLDMPLAAAKNRAAHITETGTTGRQISPELFDRYLQAFQVPTPDEPVIKLDGQQAFWQQYAELHQQLSSTQHIRLPLLVHG